MYQVYILFSPSRNRYYIGSSSQLAQRIQKHNTQHAGYTGGSGDWVLKFAESFQTKEEALQREKQIKKWKSRVLIEKLISGYMHPDD